MEYSGNDKSARNVELRALDDEMRELEFDSNPAKQGATAYDIRDMDALDLTPTFRRRFKFVAMVGFSSTVVVAWQNVLTTFGFAFYNGGTGGLFWTFIFSMIAMTFVYLTLSELASAFPTAGGQYQWVAECAPPSMRKLLSYCTGWLLVLGWQTWLCSCGVVIGNIIKYCALLYHPDSTHLATQWFPTLLAIITLFLGGLFNVYCTSKFPLLESIMLMIHWAAWLAIVVTLWVTSERSSASEVLFTFANPSGWPNGAVASLVGIITAWGSLLGYDSSVHMSEPRPAFHALYRLTSLTKTPAENAKDASRTIPFSLMTAFVTNTTLALVTMITMIFCAGSFAGEFNANSTPFIQVFLHSTKSRAATVVMTVPIMLTLWSALISQVATASRQLWAFARDGGLPWSKHLAPVRIDVGLRILHAEKLTKHCHRFTTPTCLDALFG